MRSDSAPLPRLIGDPLAAVYALAVKKRNAQFDRGKGVIQPDIPVISVGNISVGGVGKTPMVQHLTRILLEHGERPAILLRGYKAAAGQMSDEEAEHRAALPDVAVVANPDRVGALQSLTNRDEASRPTCAVLDDGFQHRRLARTFDLVLIDARRSPWRDRLLPAGWLREPPSALKRAHAVALTHADLATEQELAELRSRITDAHGQPPIAETRHLWSGVQVHSPDRRRMRLEPLEWLRGRRVAVCCAIGEPGQFVDMVKDSGAVIVGALLLRDHASFAPQALKARLQSLDFSRGDAVLCTAKDWPRLAPALPPEFPGQIAYPVLSIEAIRGADALRERVLEAVCGTVMAEHT